MTIGGLRALAALLKSTLPYRHPSISLGVCADAAAMLAAFDGARRSTHLYDHGAERYAIESVELEVDGVCFRAQGESRPLSTAEDEQLTRDGRAPGFVATTVQP